MQSNFSFCLLSVSAEAEPLRDWKKALGFLINTSCSTPRVRIPEAIKLEKRVVDGGSPSKAE